MKNLQSLFDKLDYSIGYEGRADRTRLNPYTTVFLKFVDGSQATEIKVRMPQSQLGFYRGSAIDIEKDKTAILAWLIHEAEILRFSYESFRHAWPVSGLISARKCRHEWTQMKGRNTRLRKGLGPLYIATLNHFKTNMNMICEPPCERTSA